MVITIYTTVLQWQTLTTDTAQKADYFGASHKTHGIGFESAGNTTVKATNVSPKQTKCAKAQTHGIGFESATTQPQNRYGEQLE